MAIVRTWILVAAASALGGYACGGKSTVEGTAGRKGVGDATSGAGGGAQPGSGGASGTRPGGRGGGAAVGSGRAGSADGDIGAGAGGSSAGSGTGGAGSGLGGIDSGGASSGVGGARAGGAGFSGTPDGNGEGGEAGEPRCGEVSPCGGDVDGTWTVVSSCLRVQGMLDLTRLGLGCPSSVTSGSLEVSGTWSAHADSMTISDDTTTTGEQAFWLEPACLLISGTSTTCDRLAMPLQQLGYASVTCTSGPGCNCAASVEQAGGMAFATRTPTTYGTYTTAGNLLTTTSDGSNDRQYSYCVSGKTLTMSPMVDDTQGDPLAGQPSGTIVLQKQ